MAQRCYQDPDGNFTTITARFPQKLVDVLDGMAKETYRNRSDLVRTILSACFEEAGLIEPPAGAARHRRVA